MVETKLAASRSEARRLVTQGGVSVNDVKVTAIDRVFTTADFDSDGALLIKKGKIIKKVPENQLLSTLREELLNWK